MSSGQWLHPKKPKSSTRDRDPKDWIIIAVPQIVSEEDFEKAKAQLQENKKLSPRNNKRYEYLLSGLLRCKECGYSIYGKPASNSKYKRLYYRCMGQDGHRWSTGRVCSSHPVRVEVLDELVWQQVQTLIEQPEIVVKEYTRRMDAKKKEDSNYETLLSKKKKEIRMQEQQKERLLDLYQVGTLNLAEVEERLKTLRLRITKLNNECPFESRGKNKSNSVCSLLNSSRILRKDEFKPTKFEVRSKNATCSSFGQRGRC
ncbi:MAG: recombinase zinc beta ribbon domain-containing protein [Bdellovibrionales bacterium]|nr:recombinase zinc beta ribbon domain-containing protein [Bdellovibrionales bacterium]